MVSIDIRLKIRHWFKKYKGVFFIVIVVWSVIFLVNKYLGDYKLTEAPSTTYTPTVSVMDKSQSVSKKTHTQIEELIDEYVELCNDGNYQKAFNMLSSDCKEYGFSNDVTQFAEYVLTKMPVPKKYAIQNYSNYDNYVIYEVKYTDDLLATGLTNSEYSFTTEKMTFIKNSDGSYDMCTGNFVKYDKISSVVENDYLKIDVIDRVVRYSIETYQVKFTNRTDSTIIIADGIVNDEVNLVLTNEYRNMEDSNQRMILTPGESDTYSMTFTKFADDNDTSVGILFGTVRVMETYSGYAVSEVERQDEVDNAIAKFSIQVPIK